MSWLFPHINSQPFRKSSFGIRLRGEKLFQRDFSKYHANDRLGRYYLCDCTGYIRVGDRRIRITERRTYVSGSDSMRFWIKHQNKR